MILGKRPRPPIKRTTSMTEFTLDHNHTAAVPAASNNPSPPYDPNNPPFNINPLPDGNSNSSTLDRRLLTATVSPRNHRRNSADHMELPHFLTSCHLCRRRLITGRDIFMYRGDRAFCSFECRQQQMNQDEKKDGRSTILISKKLSETVNNEYSSNTSKID